MSDAAKELLGKRVVVLDDVRNFPFTEDMDGTTVRNSQEALDLLGMTTGVHAPIDELWLDFDLGGILGQLELFDTAMPVALYLAECAFYGVPYPVETIYIHTGNPVGREAMGSLLRRFGYRVKDVEAHFGI